MDNHDSTVVAKFADLDSANKALRGLRDAQQDRGVAIRKGVVVVGTTEGAMPVADLDDLGLGDVAVNALDLMSFLGIGTAKIAAETAIAGGLLLLSSARRAAALGGSLVLMPAKRFLDALESEKVLDYLGSAVGPGTCAVVAEVDGPEDTAKVIGELTGAGGEVVKLGVGTDS